MKFCSTLLFIPFPLFLLTSCRQEIRNASPLSSENDKTSESHLSAQDSLYQLVEQNSGKSISTGTAASGTLANGKLIPFTGNNFHYFDTTSYMLKRGFMNEKVRNSLLASYLVLSSENDLNYGIMECSNEHGGKLEPHRTHQNGLSVDFMTPLLKSGNPCSDYDFIGSMHYFMNFDNNGKYLKEPEVTINFEAMARHILILSYAAEKQGLKIEKVIWEIDLQDELFATESGKKLKASGIYFTKKLSPMINQLHDDHYHIDFKLSKS